MNVILAIRDPEVLMRVRWIMSGVANITEITDIDALNRAFHRTPVDFIISEAYLGEAPVFDTIAAHPDLSWMILLNATDAWGVARHISLMGKRVAVFHAKPSVISIYLSVRATLLNDETWFESHRAWLQQNWLAAMKAFPANFGREADELPKGERESYRSWLRNKFEPTYPSHCDQISILGAMCQIARSKLSGYLDLKHSEVELRIWWNNGLPIEVDTNEPLVDIFSFAAREGIIAANRLDEIRKAGLEAIPNYAALNKKWMRYGIQEAAKWDKGDVTFKRVNYQPEIQSVFNETELARLFESCVYEISCRETLDVMRALLPFKIKLNVTADQADTLFSSFESKAVVERLQKSDKLGELLVYLPQGYPVHQTIYLLLSQGCLDID